MLTDNGTRFINHLRSSEPDRWLVARYLVAKGCTVTIGPMRETPHSSRWKEFADNGDLYADGFRIEVKGLSSQFTGLDEFPYPQGAIVCAAHSYDDANPKPYCYFLLSKDRKTAAIAYGEDHPRWWKCAASDRRYENYEQIFYWCKPSLFEFERME